LRAKKDLERTEERVRRRRIWREEGEGEGDERQSKDPEREGDIGQIERIQRERES